MENEKDFRLEISARLTEECTRIWLISLYNLNVIRIKDEESFKDYVNIYLSILDARTLCDMVDNERTKTIRKLCNDKIIRMHGKINSLTMTKYKNLRKELFGE